MLGVSNSLWKVLINLQASNFLEQAFVASPALVKILLKALNEIWMIPPLLELLFNLVFERDQLRDLVDEAVSGAWLVHNCGDIVESHLACSFDQVKLSEYALLFGSAIGFLIDFAFSNKESTWVARCSESLGYQAPDLVLIVLLRKELTDAIPELSNLRYVVLGDCQVLVSTSQNVVGHLFNIIFAIMARRMRH